MTAWRQLMRLGVTSEPKVGKPGSRFGEANDFVTIEQCLACGSLDVVFLSAPSRQDPLHLCLQSACKPSLTAAWCGSLDQTGSEVLLLLPAESSSDVVLTAQRLKGRECLVPEHSRRNRAITDHGTSIKDTAWQNHCVQSSEHDRSSCELFTDVSSFHL